MNENPRVTPNPLNPNPLDANPAEPVQSFTTRRQQRASMPTAPNMAPPQSAPAPDMAVPVESLDPTGRPMEQMPVFVDKPKKKTGLIVAFAVFAVLLIGGGIAAAIILLNMDRSDAVSVAMDKIMSGEAPANVAVEGSIEMRLNDDTSPVQTVKIDLDSDIERSSMVNTSSAVVTLSIKDMEDVSFKFDEVYAESGDLYLKLDGVTEALESSGLLNMTGNTTQTKQLVEVDCTGDEAEAGCLIDEERIEEEELVEEPTEEPIDEPIDEPVLDCDEEEGEDSCTAPDVISGTTTSNEDFLESLSMIFGIFETVDGEWLKISTDEMGLLESDGVLPESNVSCITNLVSDINTESASASDLYSKYPFIDSSSENVKLAKKNDPIYALSINNKNFADFINAIDNAKLSNDIYSCLGWDNNVSVDEDDIEAITSGFPEIYAEVDEDHNFTRLYLESDNTSANMTTLIDLSFKYPSGLNINAPNEYTDFADVLQEIFSGLYDLPDSEEDVIIEE